MEVTTPSDTEIVLTKTFPAPREVVFAALTQPDHLVHWMKTAGMDLVACEVDLRVGGKLRYVYQRPSGRKIEVRGTFEAVDPPRRLEYLETYDFSPLVVQVTTALDEKNEKNEKNEKDEKDESGESGEETVFRQTLVYRSRLERDGDLPGVSTSSKDAFARLERYLEQIAE